VQVQPEDCASRYSPDRLPQSQGVGRAPHLPQCTFGATPPDRLRPAPVRPS